MRTLTSLLTLSLMALALTAHASTPAIPPITKPDIQPATSQPAAARFDDTGILTRRVAIGGETTGLILKTDHGIFELSCFGELARTADSLEGKRVHVIGTLTTLPGTERPDRTVVAVESIAATQQYSVLPINPMIVHY